MKSAKRLEQEADIVRIKSLRESREKKPKKYLGVVIAISGGLLILRRVFADSPILRQSGSVPVPAMIFGLSAFVAAWVFILELRISQWIPTRCKVLKKESKSERGNWFPVLYYKYEVDGAVYVSDKIKINLIGSSKYDKAMKQVEQFQVGEMYDCYVNPNRPKKSVLMRKWDLFPIYILVAGSILAILLQIFSMPGTR